MSIASAAPALSIRRTSLILGISERRVFGLLAAGALRPHLEPGRSVKVDAASVSEYTRQRSTQEGHINGS